MFCFRSGLKTSSLWLQKPGFSQTVALGALTTPCSSRVGICTEWGNVTNVSRLHHRAKPLPSLPAWYTRWRKEWHRRTVSIQRYYAHHPLHDPATAGQSQLGPIGSRGRACTLHSSSATDSARQSLDKVSAGRAESVQLGAIESARVPAQARRDEPGQVKDQLGTETPGIGAC